MKGLTILAAAAVVAAAVMVLVPGNAQATIDVTPPYACSRSVGTEDVLTVTFRMSDNGIAPTYNKGNAVVVIDGETRDTVGPKDLPFNYSKKITVPQKNRTAGY
jgi:hypothetical protein